jgi:hypothetical protein
MSPSARPGTHQAASHPPRRSDAPRLRLDLFDATPSHTKMKASALAKRSLLPLIIATACGLAGALGVWALVDPDKVEPRIGATPLPAPDEPPPSNVAPQPQAAPVEPATPPAAEEAPPPEMDFSDQLLAPPARPKPSKPAAPAVTAEPVTPAAPLPSIMVTARSMPTGAAVLVRGTRMGLTPVTFKFQDASATEGNMLVLTFQLAGYETETVRHAITGPSALIDTTLEKIEPAAGEEAAEEESAGEGESDQTLQDLEERARELEAPDPVLKITPN